MADDDLHQPTTKAEFDKATLERLQLEQDLKALLQDLDNAAPEQVNELAERLKELQQKREQLKPN